VPASDSDSTEQRNAERRIFDAIERTVGKALQPRRLTLPGGANVAVDGVANDHSVLVEVFAHQGALKGGQRHKIATDVLKLITIARDLTPRPRLILAFAEPGLADWAAGRSWLAASLLAWGVEVVIVELHDDIRSEIRTAQARQVMVNPLSHSGSSDLSS
jgi:hypothetical protein